MGFAPLNLLVIWFTSREPYRWTSRRTFLCCVAYCKMRDTYKTNMLLTSNFLCKVKMKIHSALRGSTTQRFRGNPFLFHPPDPSFYKVPST